MPRSTTSQVGVRLRVVTGALLLLLVITACGADGDSSSTAVDQTTTTAPSDSNLTCADYGALFFQGRVAAVERIASEEEVASPGAASWRETVDATCDDEGSDKTTLSSIISEASSPFYSGGSGSSSSGSSSSGGATLTATSSEGDIVKLTLSIGEPQPATSAAPAGVDLADACQVGIDRATIVKFHYVVQMASSIPADVHITFGSDLDSTKLGYLVVHFSDSGWACRSDGSYPTSSKGLTWDGLSQSPQSGDFYFLIPDAISPNDPSGAFENVRQSVMMNIGANYSISAESEGDPWLLCGSFDKSLDVRVSGAKGCR